MRGEVVSRIAAVLRRLNAEQRGAVLVEFGVALPLLILLFVVLVEGGRSLWAYQSAIAGVNDAARYVARAELASGPTCRASGGKLAVTTDTQLTDIVARRVRPGLLPPPLTLDAVTAHYRCTENEYRSGKMRVATVTADVTISLPLAGLFALVDGDRRGPLRAKITHSARVLGQ